MDAQQLIRNVSKILADLDFFFTVGRTASGDVVWSLDLQPSEYSAVDIRININNAYLNIVSTIRAKDPITEPQLRTLMQINSRLALARVALAPPDVVPSDMLAVWADVALDKIFPDSVKNAIGAVVAGTIEARKVVPAAPVTELQD